MGNAPERIWATEDTAHFGEDRFHSTTPMRGLTEYLRADIATNREADLRAEVERLTQERDEARGRFNDLDLCHMGVAPCQTLISAHDEAARLRAMLDEALEALALYSCEDGCNDCAEHERDQVNCGWTARAARAKIGCQHD